MFSRQVAQMREPERTQAMINADHDNVTSPRQIRSDKESARIRSARKAPAVKPEHDRPFLIVIDAGSPHVQEEAIFAFRRGRAVGPAD